LNRKILGLSEPDKIQAASAELDGAARCAPDRSWLRSRILNGRKPVTARGAAVLDEALDAGGEVVAAADAEMASRSPRDMELVRRHLEDTIAAGAMSAAELDDWQHAMMRYGYRTREVPSPVLLDDLTGDLADLEAAVIRNAAGEAVETLGELSVVRIGNDAADLRRRVFRPGADEDGHLDKFAIPTGHGLEAVNSGQ